MFGAGCPNVLISEVLKDASGNSQPKDSLSCNEVFRNSVNQHLRNAPVASRSKRSEISKKSGHLQESVPSVGSFLRLIVDGVESSRSRR